MIPRAATRFALEAAFLVLVAVVAGLARLAWEAIVAVMFVAWLAVAAAERASAQAAGREPGDEQLPLEEEVGEALGHEPARAGPDPWGPPPRPRPWSRARAAERMRRGLPRPQRVGRRPEPVVARPVEVEIPVEERLCVSCGRPISPDRLRALPGALQCLQCKRSGRPLAAPEPAPEPEPEPGPEPGAPARPLWPPAAEAAQEPSEPEGEPEPQPDLEPEPAPEPVAAPAPRRWNLWELERLARGRAGGDPARDEEWGYLLVYLREYVGPDGALPVEFDGLVRDSFGELVGP